MNRILLIVGGVLVGLLAALFVVPVFVDWNRYRGAFEEEATRLLGRDVRMSGRVNLRLLPTPYIRFEKVRIADTQAGIGEPIFKADDFTVWLAVGPLFSGVLEASELELKKPVVTLVMDDKGSGNWSDLASRKPTSSFLPSSVALNAVRITDGSVAILAPGGIERARFERINGELAAASLQGPYKINATYANAGAPREMRLSTAAPEADGSVRFKGTVRASDVGASYTLDGRAMDVLGQLKIDGELVAKLPMPARAGPQAPKSGAPDGDGGIEFKSAFKADTQGIELSDIALAFEQAGRPQLASGTARIAWRQRTDLDLTLTSKWLDLDKIGGEDAQARPLTVLARLARSLGGQLPADGRTAVRVDLDQATLGGEVVSAVSAAIERTGEGLALKSFSAALPGNSRIEASGLLTPTATDALFDGPVVFRGASLSRVLAWGARGLDLGTFSADGSFIATGRMRLGEALFDGRGLTVQLGRHALGGDVLWSGGDARKLRLTLEGSEIDLTPFTDREASPLAALKAAIGKLAGTAATGQGQPAATGPVDVQAHVRFGRVLLGRTTLPDVAANVSYVDGNLALSLLRIGLAEDWQVEVRGDLAGALRPGARGTLSGHIYAQTAEKLDELLALLDVPADLRPGPRRQGLVVPLRLAGRIGIGEKGPDTYDMQVDGRAGASRIAGTLRFEQTGAAWTERPADIALTLDGADARQLLAQIAPDAWQPTQPSPTAGAAPARISLRAIGTPKQGLDSLVLLDAANAAGEFRGRIGVTDTAALSVAGDVRFNAADIGRSVQLAGYRSRAGLDSVAVAGSLAITGSGSRWTLSTSDVAVAAQRLTGRLDVDSTAAALKVSGDLKVQLASLPVAFALLAGSDPAQSQRITTPGRTSPLWATGAFDFSALGNIDMTLTLLADRLALAPGITVGTAAVDVVAKDRSLKLSLTRANALGGDLTGQLHLAQTPTGASLAGTAQLAAARLDALVAGPTPRAQGGAALKLTLDATAHAPDSLVAALRGLGELQLTDARIAGLSPMAARTVADAITSLKGELPPGEVLRQLTAGLDTAPLAIGRQTVAITISDAVARLAPIVVETAEGRVTALTHVDLAGLRVDSEWRLEPKPTAADQAQRRSPLPVVPVIYTGSLQSLGALQRRIDIDAFERELMVRKYERDVEELERIRREDEERIRREAERRRLEEQLREAPVTTPTPLPPGPAPAPVAEPQKQSGLELPRTPRLPPLNLLALQPEQRAVLAPQPVAQPAMAPEPAPTAGNIPASADTPPQIAAPAAPVARRATPRAPQARRDVFRDISRDSP